MKLDDIRECKICRHFFRYSGFGPLLCPACKKEDEEMFQKVKNYLIYHPGSTLVQISEECEVPTERIRLWLKEERLQFTGSGDTGLRCEHCGQPISSGRLCNECRQSFARVAGEMKRSVDKPVPEKKVKHDSGDRMRFLHK